jgi:hypothetical protein
MYFRAGVAIVLAALVSGSAARGGGQERGGRGESLSLIAIGEAGESNSVLRGCAGYVTDMHTGRHNAGRFDLLLFLGDSFGPTGLNVPPGDVRRNAEAILGPFSEPMNDIGPVHVHSIAGEHDYYARNAIEESLLLGLVKVEEAPIGLTDRGNRREAALEGWTHHYGTPSDAVFPISPGSGDSVQFIFFDSAIMLRTPEAAWNAALGRLAGILAGDRGRPRVLWRIFCAHHPFMSAGEHAGYTAWDDDTDSVEYVPPCDRDSSALSWVRNILDPEDLCAGRYRSMVDSLRRVIRRGGVKVQFALSAHDHSLQILSEPSAPGNEDLFPSIQIISGAGSAPSRVNFPDPPGLFTAAKRSPSERGESLPGFVRITFTKEICTVVFYNGENGDPIDMGGGTKVFHISSSGLLISN